MCWICCYRDINKSYPCKCTSDRQKVLLPTGSMVPRLNSLFVSVIQLLTFHELIVILFSSSEKCKMSYALAVQASWLPEVLVAAPAPCPPEVWIAIGDGGLTQSVWLSDTPPSHASLTGTDSDPLGKPSPYLARRQSPAICPTSHTSASQAIPPDLRSPRPRS